MNKPTPKQQNAANRKGEQRAAFWLAVIVGGFVALSIVGMLVFDYYGENSSKVMSAPSDERR